MEQKSRRGRDPDGSVVLLGGERAEPTPIALETQFSGYPILSTHLWRIPAELAVRP